MAKDSTSNNDTNNHFFQISSVIIGSGSIVLMNIYFSTFVVTIVQLIILIRITAFIFLFLLAFFLSSSLFVLFSSRSSSCYPFYCYHHHCYQYFRSLLVSLWLYDHFYYDYIITTVEPHYSGTPSLPRLSIDKLGVGL